MELFSRNVKLTIDYGSSVQVIENLDMDFTVKTSRDSKPNTATVNVFNLSEESRGRIKDPRPLVTLEVGHGDTLFTIFVGNISKASHTHTGVDWKTQIQLTDGDVPLGESMFSRTYNANTTVNAIISDVSASFGSATKVINYTTTALIESSLTLDGKSKDVMDQLAASYGFYWSFVQGTLEVTADRTPPITAPLAPVMTLDNGLIAAPERLDTGVRLHSYILNGLRPNGSVIVNVLGERSVQISGGSVTRTSNTELNGSYLIDKVTYIGSTYDDRFDAITEGLAP